MVNPCMNIKMLGFNKDGKNDLCGDGVKPWVRGIVGMVYGDNAEWDFE